MPKECQTEPPSADFIALITRAQRALHAFIFTLVRDAVDADDVLQETNVVLWSKAVEFDATRDFMPWAFTIARFQAMAHLKKRQRARVFFDDELLSRLADEAVAEFAEMDSRRRALAGCLQKLPEPQRALISQRYEPNASVNELARARNTTPKALSEMLRRIRHSLLLCIEQTLRKEATT